MVAEATAAKFGACIVSCASMDTRYRVMWLTRTGVQRRHRRVAAVIQAVGQQQDVQQQQQRQQQQQQQ